MSIFPNGKLPIYVDSQLRYIRLAQIRAEAQATREAESRKLMAQEIAKAIQAAQSGNNKPSTVGSLSQDDFAKACGVTKRQVQRWEKRDSTPPTLYDETTQKMVTYSAEMRNDPVKAQVFARNYKTHKRIKKAAKGATQYKEGTTDEVNERIKQGIPKSTRGKKSDYEGEADSKGIAGLRRAVWGNL